MSSVDKLIILDKLETDYIKIKSLLLLILLNSIYNNNLRKYRYS